MTRAIVAVMVQPTDMDEDAMQDVFSDYVADCK